MNLRSVILAYLVISATSLAHAKSHGSYHVKVPGFGQRHGVDQGHFDEVGQLNGCENAGPGLIFRGGAPDLSNKNAVMSLQDNKIGIVIDLRVENATSRRIEEKALLKNGIEYVNVGLTTEMPVPKTVRVKAGGKTENVETIDAVRGTVEFIRQKVKAGVNVYVHCAHGEDRTGMIMGLFRGCEGWKKEFSAYGGTYYPALKKMKEAVEKEATTVNDPGFNAALKTLNSKTPPCD